LPVLATAGVVQRPLSSLATLTIHADLGCRSVAIDISDAGASTNH